MADNPYPAINPSNYDWMQTASNAVGGNPAQNPSTSFNPLASIIQALLAKKQADQPGGTSGFGTYEGAVPSPANPYNGSSYGMQSQPAPAQPQFGQGAQPVPYMNQDPTMSALFSPPPSNQG